ncbi:hypothetical protein [Enterococcus sp. AZ126]|uniref:hypothetical protein n=1 Tax=Enterococcus sp. AZ126 TaxID=2774635 RepID=UPI003F1F24DE
MPKKHELGDYLYKDGNIYKIIPNWGSLDSLGNLASVFLEESTNQMFTSTYAIDKYDFSYISATKEQIEKFDFIEQRLSNILKND